MYTLFTLPFLFLFARFIYRHTVNLLFFFTSIVLFYVSFDHLFICSFASNITVLPANWHSKQIYFHYSIDISQLYAYQFINGRAQAIYESNQIKSSGREKKIYHNLNFKFKIRRECERKIDRERNGCDH